MNNKPYFISSVFLLIIGTPRKNCEEGKDVCDIQKHVSCESSSPYTLGVYSKRIY